MVSEVFSKIKEIEEKAQKIISNAQHAAMHNVNLTNQHHSEELRKAFEEAQKDTDFLILAAEKGSQKEVAEIEAETKIKIAQLKEKAAAKFSLAKKELLKWLS